MGRLLVKSREEQRRAESIQTRKYDNPCYGNPQKGPLTLRSPSMQIVNSKQDLASG